MNTTIANLTAPVSPSSTERAKKLPRAKHVVPGRQFRSLASRIISLRGDVLTNKTIGVASCSRNEGNSTVASNLAVAINAAVQGEVLLVDCVEPSKSQSKRRNHVGWFDFVFGEAELLDIIQSTDCPKLSVISAGLPIWHDGATYSRDRLTNVVQLLKERFEFVVFDLPCADDMTGCMPIAGVLDGVILNLKSGRSNSSKASRIQRDFQLEGAHVVGVVLNQTQSHVPRLLRYIFGESESSI
jgi:protein-tyrosine kinase